MPRRNQFDYYRALPGGLHDLANVTAEFHRHNVKVLWGRAAEWKNTRMPCMLPPGLTGGPSTSEWSMHDFCASTHGARSAEASTVRSAGFRLCCPTPEATILGTKRPDEKVPIGMSSRSSCRPQEAPPDTPCVVNARGRNGACVPIGQVQILRRHKDHRQQTCLYLPQRFNDPDLFDAC